MNYLFNGISLQNGRQSNMDSLLLKQGLINKTNAMLAVVCDGVGSLADGDFASGTAVRMLSNWFSNATTTEHIGLRMRDSILGINAHVVSEAKQRGIETASTLSALLLIEQSYYIAHVGDSRIYCYKDGALTILTSDDVSDTGKLTACIGRTEDIFLQYSEGPAAGKTFIVCSDGLYQRMDTDFIITKLKTWNKKSLKEIIEVLPQYVIERGEKDNISLALVKVED
jgi:serine/threonine protein phosphatase PrpC